MSQMPKFESIAGSRSSEAAIEMGPLQKSGDMLPEVTIRPYPTKSSPVVFTSIFPVADEVSLSLTEWISPIGLGPISAIETATV